jgi:tetratricopeptide (TPR) repeat protein
VVVNNYYPADADAAGAAPEAPQEPPEAQQATQLFDEGLALFKSADYKGALPKFDAALAKLPGDPVIHEVRALTLFALGDYADAAAALNSFLSSAPGMDWTTMSSLYPDVEIYKTQLRELEQFAKAHPRDAAAHFVLAYHYLVIGAKDEAVAALKVVVKNEPRDATARRMLDALEPPAASPPAQEGRADAADAPQTDLVGKWRAKADDATIDLEISEDWKFTWKAVQPDKPPTELSGELIVEGEQLVLQSADQGAMAGEVKSLGPDSWSFALTGAPPSAPGLTFDRVK